MSKNVIEIRDLSKKYIIGHENNNPYASLKEIISDYGKGLINTLRSKSSQKNKMTSPKSEEFWAIKDLSLDVQQGDRIALLGRNGAGKSTFLKLLSRITEPTKGTIKIRGRVSSLLEVGTGFHPELTGRENILFSGAIMGMSYKEIRQKFDEIVAFADIEKFLDTPMKRYSSGMFMRLGFAIAAHLDSDLLIVDEVLAVGDAQFQEKCLKKMNEIGAQGSTIFFVSHNVNSVLSLCNKGVLLNKGRMECFEPIEKCIGRYLRHCPTSGFEWKGDIGDEHIRIYNASLKPPTKDLSFFHQEEKTQLDINCEVLKPNQGLIIGFSVLNSNHHPIARSRWCDVENYEASMIKNGKQKLSFHLDLSLFHPGEYQIKLDCSILNQKKIIQDEILLKFAVYSPQSQLKLDTVGEKHGISLGNRWMLS